MADQDTADQNRGKQPLTAEAVTWAFRLLLSRDPASPEEVEAHRGLPDLAALRRTFSNTWEFHDFFDSVLDGEGTYCIPQFLMRPPADAALPWVFEPPSLDSPASHLCTTAQFEEPVFLEIAEAMGMAPTHTRRSWEQAWIVSCLATAGHIAPGQHGLGFGVGRERIASLLASRGVRVLATDAPDQPDDVNLPADARRMALFHPEVLHLEDFESLVTYEPLDMRQIPERLAGQFDFCWSASALDRLGSLALATEFLEASLGVLKPGGLSVHTMALNIRSNRATLDHGPHVLLRRRDIEALVVHLQAQGHSVMPINLHPGLDAADAEVSVRPDTAPKLKLRVGALVATSFGLAIRKAS